MVLLNICIGYRKLVFFQFLMNSFISKLHKRIIERFFILKRNVKTGFFKAILNFSTVNQLVIIVYELVGFKRLPIRL